MPPIKVKFEIPYFTVSGLQVSFGFHTRAFFPALAPSLLVVACLQSAVNLTQRRKAACLSIVIMLSLRSMHARLHLGDAFEAMYN